MRTFFFALLPFLFLACSDDDDATPIVDCGPEIEFFDLTVIPASDGYTITEATVTDRCLEVTLAATGCSAEAWTAELLTNGVVAESSPTQTSAFLTVDLQQDSIVCQAVFQRTFTFDLRPYLTDAVLPSRFRIQGPDVEILVE